MKTLEKAFEEMQGDGGDWREVRFYTKSPTSKILQAINKLDGLANVYIYSDIFILKTKEEATK